MTPYMGKQDTCTTHVQCTVLRILLLTHNWRYWWYLRTYVHKGHEFFPTLPHRAITALQTLVNVHSSKYRDSRGRTVMHILAEQVRKQHTTPAISLTVLCSVCAHICTSVIGICSKAQRFNFCSKYFAAYVHMYVFKFSCPPVEHGSNTFSFSGVSCRFL